MRKWLIIAIYSILAILVIVMVFRNGWISVVTTDLAIVALPAIPIAHETGPVQPTPSPITMATIQTTPVPTPTTLTTIRTSSTRTPTTEATIRTTAIPTPTTVRTSITYEYGEATYIHTTPKPTITVNSGIGTLVLRATTCPSDGLTVFIARNGTTDSPVDNPDLLDRLVAEDENTGFLYEKILPDGSSEMVRLSPGFYTAYLPDKDGDAIEEQQSFLIGPNVMSYVSFLASSYRTPSSSSCTGCSCRR